MPSILDTSMLMDPVETNDFHTEQPQRHSAPRSFWRTLIQSMRHAHGQRSERTPCAYGLASYPMESPADQLARRSPKLYLQAFAGSC
jgi:hypothetical protein